jgi:hypothetical protein
MDPPSSKAGLSSLITSSTKAQAGVSLATFSKRDAPRA